MFESLENIKQYGSITLVIVSILMIFVSGIFFSVVYFVMDTTETGFKNSHCDIQNNVYVDNCQDLWSLSVYPFLALKDIFIWFSFFFIFSLVLGMLLVGYQSGNSPVLLGLLVVFTLVMTYVGILLSNVYRTMLENATFRAMLTDFTVYNKVMLYFPQFVFFVGTLSVILSVVNYQKTHVNKVEADLSY